MIMRFCALPFVTRLLALLAALFVLPTAALFADEAYQVDYHYPLLGPPQIHNTFFHRPSANSKAALIYTLSERNILGAVNPKDGVLLWRQRLLDQGTNRTTRAFLRAGGGADVVISAVDENLQAWDAVDGRLVWESKSYGKIRALEVLPDVAFENDVLVAYEVDGNKVVIQRLAANTGLVKWTYQDASGNVPHALVSTGQATYYLSLHSGLLGSYKIHISQLDLQSNGKAATQPASPADGEVASEDLILYVGNNAGTPLLVWTDKTFKTVKINVIGSKQVTTVNTAPRAGEAIDKIAFHAAGAAGSQPHFLIHYQSARSHWAEVFHASGSKVSKAFVLPHVEGKGAFSACSLADEVYFSRYTSSEVSLYSSRRETVLSQWTLRHETSGLQDPVHGVSEVIMRAGAKYSMRSALAFPAGDWTLVRNDDVLWSRPEGLAGIVAAAFVGFGRGEDLLQTLALEGQRNVFGAYIRRVTRHIYQIQHIPHWLRGLPSRILPALFEGQADPHAQSLQDQGFGFSKLIIVATEGGRIAAVDSGQHGKVLWSVQAVNVPDGQVWSVLSIEPEENSVLVRGSAGESLRISTSTGAVSDYQPGRPTSSLRTSIPVRDSHGRKHLIPINRDGSLGDISNMDFVEGTVVVTEGDDDVVRGWRLSRSSKNTLAWQFKPGAGERVQSVQPRPSHNPVASIGKVLGDRNVLYKYLNPNLMLIVATAVELSTASTYVIDSVSGAVLHSSTHTGVDTRQPISSVLTENWLAYSLFSESGTVPENSAQIDRKAVAGYQLIITEMFESRFPNDRGPLGDSANFSSIRPVSADEAGSGDFPHVISQTFLLPGPIAHMATTSTLQGITPQSLLCALPQTQALLSIPRYFIDPRRPVGRDPSPVEAEEGLFKYSPLLEFEPKWLLNHKRELIGISSVITSPSKLESTSLVFAYGDADIFGSRVSPIGLFDMLGKGFSKLQLIGTVVALAAGTSLLAPFVKRKQIDGQWKV